MGTSFKHNSKKKEIFCLSEYQDCKTFFKKFSFNWLQAIGLSTGQVREYAGL